MSHASGRSLVDWGLAVPTAILVEIRRMRPALVRTAPFLAATLLAATPALAQSRGDYVECFRDGRKVACDDTRSDKDRDRDRDRDRERSDRERTERDRAETRAREVRDRALERAAQARDRAAEVRERALQRAAETRARALEEVRVRQRELEWRRDEDRRVREERLRESRRQMEERRARDRRYYDDVRPRLSVGGGVDMRRFDDVNRYLVQGAVDFRTRSGIGVRPEVVYGWSDEQRESLPSVLNCPGCNSVGVDFRSRSKMLGVNLNGTYAFMRRSWIRPYVLGGVGVLTTRESTPEASTSTASAGSPILSVTYRAVTNDRVDFGLNAGSGLEFGVGPVHLYTEFRYFLSDRSTTRGFSGMLPITAGLRF